MNTVDARRARPSRMQHRCTSYEIHDVKRRSNAGIFLWVAPSYQRRRWYRRETYHPSRKDAFERDTVTRDGFYETVPSDTSVYYYLCQGAY